MPVEGIVLRPDGTPAKGASVSVTTGECQTIFDLRTDDAGRFRVTLLVGEPYRLTGYGDGNLRGEALVTANSPLNVTIRLRRE